MRPVDFIGRVLKADGKEVVSQVEGTIFQYEDKLAGTSGWQGSFLKWKNEATLMAALQASDPVLLVCNDGRQGMIMLESEMADWGIAGLRFRGAGPLSEPKVPPSWRNLDRIHSEDGVPDAT